jgi:endonuclease/exonuclease/phosphatase family metal-dependent hydrolase
MPREASDQALHIDEDFMPPGWKWVYDPDTPTNRALNEPYHPNIRVRLIDFYLVSPNVDALEVETRDMRFRHSDHQPVWLRFQMK